MERVAVARNSHTRLVRHRTGRSGLRVLRFPAVANKGFLIHIGDRTVGGLSVRDQLVGPWQVPVSDVAITATGYEDSTGEAMSMGERTPLAAMNAPASGRMAVAEAVTNIAAARIEDIKKIRLSANWMAAAGHPGEDANLFDTVKAVGDELCRDLGIAIPVGKDSMSLRASWQEGGEDYQVVAPVSLIVTAFAPVSRRAHHDRFKPQVRRAAGGVSGIAADSPRGWAISAYWRWLTVSHVTLMCCPHLRQLMCSAANLGSVAQQRRTGI